MLLVAYLFFMIWIRKHIHAFYRLTAGGFILSWLLMAIVLPIKILGFTESHSVYSIFNADEGCFELVVAHQKEANELHFMDEETDVHSFHNSCCFDVPALTFNKQKTDFNLPLSYESEGIEFNLLSERILTPVSFQEHPLPPPATYQELRITRLLI